jgi:hypothetical protein
VRGDPIVALMFPLGGFIILAAFLPPWARIGHRAHLIIHSASRRAWAWAHTDRCKLCQPEPADSDIGWADFLAIHEELLPGKTERAS